MPTENWYPISAATHDLPAGMDDWAAGGSGTVNKNANTRIGGGRSGPATHDDDVSYINRAWAAATEEQALNIDWPGPMVEVDASSMFHGNGRHRVSGSTRRLLRFSNAAGTKGNAYVDVTDSNASYASTGPVDVSNATTYRPGGGSWVLADFADDKTLFVCCQITSGNAVFTSIWGDIAYTPPAGVLVFLLQLAGHGALPFVGAMDFGQFLHYLSWRRRCHPRHTILTGDEVRQAWRELREYRHPRFFLPAL